MAGFGRVVLIKFQLQALSQCLDLVLEFNKNALVQYCRPDVVEALEVLHILFS